MATTRLRPFHFPLSSTSAALKRCGTPIKELMRASKTARSYSTTPSSSASKTITWPEYLSARKSRRKWEMATTIPTIAICFGAGVSYFANAEVDASKPIMGIDPLYVYAFATIACGGVGYLAGPAIGSMIWRVTHRKKMALIDAREREFHQHIVRNRVNPRAQSATNPVPDFYGEKIGSLHEYRQWLRDQSRYKKKAQWLEDAE